MLDSLNMKATLTIYDHGHDVNWKKEMATVNEVINPFGLFIDYNVVEVKPVKIKWEKPYKKNAYRVDDKWLRETYYKKTKTTVGLVYFSKKQWKFPNLHKGQSIDETY